MPEPWNGPGIGRHLALSLFKPNAAMKLRLSAVPGLLDWGAYFLWNSRKSPRDRATAANFQLCHYSRVQTQVLMEKHKFKCDAAFNGTLKIFTDASALAASSQVAESLRTHGLVARILTPDEAVTQEPLLAPTRDRIKGAILYPDGSGDPFLFTELVMKRLIDIGAEVITAAPVKEIRMRNNCVFSP